MPVLQPAELWRATGRYDIDELFKLQDRRGADLVLAMTHEETLTFHIAREVRSYRDLPKILYHFQTKERDEPRPRAGLLRTREFIMKDAYSFDRDREGLERLLRAPRRGLRPHLRPQRARVVPGGVRRRDDGRLRRPRVHGAVRGGRERRGALRRRLRRERGGRQRRRRSRSTGCPRRSPQPEAVETPGRDHDRRGLRAARACRRARSIKAFPVIAEERGPRARGRPRRPPPERDQAPERARRARSGAAEAEEVRGALRRRAGLHRPGGRARARARRRGAARPRRPRGGRERARRAPARRRARPRLRARVGRRAARWRRATRDPSGSPIRIEPAIEVGNIFKLGTRYSEPLGATYLDEDGQGAARSGWAPTGSARPGSWPPRSSSSPTSRASRGRARWRPSTSSW